MALSKQGHKAGVRSLHSWLPRPTEGLGLRCLTVAAPACSPPPTPPSPPLPLPVSQPLAGRPRTGRKLPAWPPTLSTRRPLLLPEQAQHPDVPLHRGVWRGHAGGSPRSLHLEAAAETEWGGCRLSSEAVPRTHPPAPHTPARVGPASSPSLGERSEFSGSDEAESGVCD